MSQHTPIDQLTTNDEQNKDQLVQNILNSYDSVSEGGVDNTANQEQAEHNSRLAEQQFNSDLGYDNQNVYQDQDDYYDEPVVKSSPVDNLINSLKNPVLVFVLVFLTNYKLLNELLLKNVPRFVNSSGNLNYMGITAKALVAAVLFFVVNKFLL